METILNWLWQGSIVAALATGLIRWSRFSATTRYRLWWMTLVVVLVLPLVSFFGAGADSGIPSRFPVEGADAPSRYVVSLPATSWWIAAAGAALWFAWLALNLFRTAAALVTLHRAKRQIRPFPYDRELELPRWQALRSRGRKATLVLSDDVGLAAVLGLTAPSVAVAPRLLSELSGAELDRIVVHEWAHVQRRDDLARLGQLLVKAAAGLHPAVWWIDRQIQLEREIACDDWTINLTGSPRSYAASLAKLASIGARQPAAALLPAALSASHLTERVMRLLDAKRSTSTQGRPLPLILAGTCMLALGPVVAGQKLVVIAPPMENSLPLPAAAVAAFSQRDAHIAQPVASASQPRLLSPPSSRLERVPPAPQLPATPSGPTPAPSRAPEISSEPLPSIASVAGVPELPGTKLAVVSPLDAASGRSSQVADPSTPWGAAADAGVTAGRGSQKAAVATAGFFTQFGKSIARSFK